MSNFEIVFLICIGATAVSAAASLVCVTRMLGVLKRDNPAEFQRLGSPHLVMNNTPTTNMRIFSFLKNREYEATRDHAIIKLASRTRKMYVATFCLFLVSVALLILVWASR